MKKERNSQEDMEKKQGAKKVGLSPHIYMHIALLAVTLVCIVVIAYRLANWGERVNLDEIFKDGAGTVTDNFDQFVPLMDADHNPIYQVYDENATILAFGNAPFADDRDSEDNLIKMIQEMTDATIYNCSISGSYLAAESRDLNGAEHPWDVFTFYSLCRLAVGADDSFGQEYLTALQTLGDNAPAEAMEVYDILTTVDMSTVDVVVAMYDGSDYLAGHAMYSDDDYTDPTQFTGNMEAGIEYLQYFSPNTRIIILSPAYAYGIDANGNYISSDIQRYGWDVLSTYVIKQCSSCLERSVTFVDNLYGTIHEDNADDYLIDHLHLNTAGRRKVAERFLCALNYFQESD